MTCFLVLTVTLTVYPGTSNYTTINFIESTAWFNLYMVSLFHVFDTVARYSCSWPVMWIKEENLLKLALIRLLFIPSFIAITYNVQPVFGTDWFKTLHMAVFAFSNGHLSGMCGIYAPMRVSPHLKEIIGTFIGICVTSGVSIGSLLSIGLIPLIPS